MNSVQDDDLKYYDKRIEEFDKLLTQVKSQTLIDLVKKAKAETEKSIEKLIQIQKAIIIYLKAYEIKNDERLGEFSKQVELQSTEVKKLKESNAPESVKQVLLQFYKTLTDEIGEKLDERERVRKLTFQVFTACANDFRITLLEKIFKPNTSQFHYESIIELLNLIAGKFIPFLDEAKLLSNSYVPIRRKQFAKQGDKVLVYLEQYIDVLEKWTILGDKCIEITET